MANSENLFSELLKAYTDTNNALFKLTDSLNNIAQRLDQIPKEEELKESLKTLQHLASRYFKEAFADADFTAHFTSIINKLDDHFNKLRLDLKKYEEFICVMKDIHIKESEVKMEACEKDIDRTLKIIDSTKERKNRIWLVVIPVVLTGLGTLIAILLKYFNIIK